MDIKEILALIEEAMDAAPVIQAKQILEEEKVKSIEDILGNLTINTSRWGAKVSNESDNTLDRQIVEHYVKSLESDGTPDGVFQALQNNLMQIQNSSPDRQEGTCQLSKTVSTIQLLNTISRVFAEFDATTAGFIMEGFLSALFGGYQVRATDTAGIQDFIIPTGNGEEFYSLKSIANGKSVEGAGANLVRGLAASVGDRYEDLDSAHMIYYVLSKEGQGSSVSQIEVFKFTLTADDARKLVPHFDEIWHIYTRRHDQASKPKSIADIAGDLGLQKKVNEGDKSVAHYLRNSFKIKSSEYATSENLIATLVTDDQKLLQVANENLEDIKSQLLEVQQRFDQVLLDMNHFLSTMTATSAERFKSDTNIFSETVQKNVHGDESCTPPTDLVKENT